MKFILIFVWSLAFVFLSYFTKQYAASLPLFSSGFFNIAKFLVLSPQLYVIVALYGLCSASYMALLRFMPLTLAGPLVCVLGVVLTSCVGIFFLRESIAPLGCIGLFFCLLGVVCLTAART